MRRIARVFIALFCITFLANQAMSTDTGLERLATLVSKMMKHSANGFNAHAKGLAYLNKRITLIENSLHVEMSTADELAVKRMMSEFGEAGIEYQAAQKELSDYVDYIDRLAR